MSNILDVNQSRHLYNVDKANTIIPIMLYQEGDELINTKEQEHYANTTCPCNATVVNDNACVLA